MGLERCPACAASVRKDADWCTLCYADLRPAPAPVQRAPYPQPSAPPAYAAAAAPTTADALHAPYEHVLAAVYGGGALQPNAPDAVAVTPVPVAKPVGWPCSQCGELNDFERMTCSVCMTAFGATLRSGNQVFERKKIMLYAGAAAAVVLLLMAVLTFALTKASPTEVPADGPAVITETDNSQQFAPPVEEPLAPAVVDVAPPQPGQPLQPGTPELLQPGQPPGQPAPLQPGQVASAQPGQVAPGGLPPSAPLTTVAP